MRPGMVVCAALATGCSDARVYLEAPWSEDQLIVLALLDRDGRSLAEEPIVQPGAEHITLRLEPETQARVLARAYPGDLRGPNGDPAAQCGIGFAGIAPLGAPQGAWISPPLLDGEDTLSFTPDSDGSFSNAVPLLFRSCDASCEGYDLTLLQAGNGVRTDRVAALDGTTAYFTGATSDVAPTTIGRIQDRDVSLVDLDPRLDGFVSALRWDPRGVLWVVRDTGDTGFRFTRDLVPLPGPILTHVDDIAITTDGSTFMLDKDQQVFEQTATSTTFVLRPDFPLLIDHLVAVRRDRIFVEADRRLLSFDGTTWTLEDEVDLFENIQAMAGDAEVAVAVGELELVRVRNEVSKNWDLIQRPFDRGAQLRGVAMLGGGRFIVVGDQGGLGIWTGTRWCSFTPTPVTLARVSVAPGGALAYAVPNKELGPNGETIVVRVSIPPPR